MNDVPRPIKFLKGGIFIASLLPLAWLAGQFLFGDLGANPIEKALHLTGDWTLNFLILTLAITPLRRLTRWEWLSKFRRMIGLFAFCYAFLHFLIYIGLDQFFSWEAMVKDFAVHPRLFVGLLSFILLMPPTITSSARMIARLGIKRWQWVHRPIYLAAIGGVIHYFWLVKRDIQRPLVYAIILGILLGYRLVMWTLSRSRSAPPPL
ncbi:MAG: sulfoxide reductase heme-binding subunit YedZ [Candidatus Aminicenantes bacterium]|nr:sulfoxide reductase heme-binding subunit YedZ [Candidatus Aminicenantes bacterium]